MLSDNSSHVDKWERLNWKCFNWLQLKYETFWLQYYFSNLSNSNFFNYIARRPSTYPVFMLEYVISWYQIKCPRKELFSLQWAVLRKCRNKHQKCSVQKGFLKNFTKFTRKHLCLSFLIKLQAWALQLYEKRSSDTGVFL